MLLMSSCSKAIQTCKETKTFAVAHLYNDDVPMKIHIHDTYEIYYSISGGKQFLIDDRFYDFEPGDIFFINQYESHYLSQLDEARHERIVISIYPEFLIQCSTPMTDLNYCFSRHDLPSGHKVSLTPDEREKFMYYIHRFQDNGATPLQLTPGSPEPDKIPFGQDILDRTNFMEMMLFLNQILRMHNEISVLPTQRTGSHHEQVDDILSFINQNISDDLSIDQLASHFFMSSSNICKIFKETTGTTLNRYITAKRITLAKEYLSQGRSVTDACLESGFRDYSNFLKAFTKAVGVSPKKYAAMTGI